MFLLTLPPASLTGNSCSSPTKSLGRLLPTKESGNESQQSGPAKTLTLFPHRPIVIKEQNFARLRDGVKLSEVLADLVDIISHLTRGLCVVSHLQ